MNLTYFKYHAKLLAFYFACILLAIILSSINTQSTAWISIQWSDVIGESSIVLLTIFWTLTLMMSRPAGQVTNLLIIGLGLFTFSAMLDMLDEFTQHLSSVNWISLFESIPAALGMLIMSYALFLWHQEQLALNRQLRGKELNYRSHKDIDVITQLYRPEYWKDCANKAIKKYETNIIIALNLTDFSGFNHKFGVHEGDRHLRELAQLALMNIRDTDLACRYASDRFIILLPNTNIEHGLAILKQVIQSIEHVAFKPNNNTTSIYASIRGTARSLQIDNNLDEVLTYINQELDQQTDLVA